MAAVRPRRRVGTILRLVGTGWHHTQVFHFYISFCNGPGRSKREKEEETTRTVVVRRRHQSDSDDGTDHAVNQYSIYKSDIS